MIRRLGGRHRDDLAEKGRENGRINHNYKLMECYMNVFLKTPLKRDTKVKLQSCNIYQEEVKWILFLNSGERRSINHDYRLKSVLLGYLFCQSSTSHNFVNTTYTILNIEIQQQR